MRDLIIIGSGPAGLAALTYALAKGLDALVIGTQPGGRVGERQHYAEQSEPAALVGEAAVSSLQQHLMAHTERIITDVVVAVLKGADGFVVRTEGTTRRSRAVIIATGVQPRRLDLPSEWRSVGLGLGYSITTHAHAVAGRDVAVVGTTSHALRGVAELVHLAQCIALIAPEPGELGSPLGQRLRAHPRVQVLDGYQVTAVEASAGSVQAVVVAREDRAMRLPVQAVFVDLGVIPNAQLVQHLVQLDARGAIVVDEWNSTALPGLFAAGDVTNVVCEQMLIAIGEGTRAAVSAYDYILAQRLQVSATAMYD